MPNERRFLVESQGGAIESVNRRSFLLKGSAGAAGVAGAGFVGGGALSKDGGTEPLSSDELATLGDEPVLVQIRDAAAGEVEVLVGEREVVFTDRALVAKVLRATR